VLYRYGVVLPPAMGAMVRSLSTIIVAVNARMISYQKERQGGEDGFLNATRQVKDEHEPLNHRR